MGELCFTSTPSRGDELWTLLVKADGGKSLVVTLTTHSPPLSVCFTMIVTLKILRYWERFESSHFWSSGGWKLNDLSVH